MFAVIFDLEGQLDCTLHSSQTEADAEAARLSEKYAAERANYSASVAVKAIMPPPIMAAAPTMLEALRKISQGADCFTFNSDADVFRFVDMVAEIVAPVLARIDGAAPAPTAQPAGAIGEAGGDEPQKPVCRSCGGDSVVIDGAARWNMAGQDWGLSGTYDDSAYCDDCEDETKLNWVAVAPDELAAANLSGPALIAAAREAEALAGEA